MIKFMEHKSHTIRMQMTLLIICTLIVAAILIGITAEIALNTGINETLKANGIVTKLLIEQTEETLDSIKKSLLGMIADFDMPEALCVNNNTAKIAQYRAQTKLREESYGHSYVNLYYMYIPGQQTLIEYSNNTLDIEKKAIVTRDLVKYLENSREEIVFSQWIPIQFDKQYYLMLCNSSVNLFYGALIRTDDLISHLFDKKAQTNDYLFYVASDGTALTERSEIDIKQYSNTFENGVENGYVDTHWIVSGAEYSNHLFTIVALTRIINVIKPFIRLMICCIISFVLLIITAILIIIRVNKTVVQPVESLSILMEEMKSGEIPDCTRHGKGIHELKTMENVFLDMKKLIEKLKVDIYEEQLLKQKTQLTFYRLQIHPHFFLNCMNLICVFARAGKQDLVLTLAQRMCLFYNYSIRNTGDYISFQQEIEHCQSYLDIQRMRFGDSIDIEISIDECLFSALVPPLLITTFVENSIKYARIENNKMFISINAHIDDNNKDINIQIIDNGPGINEDMMDDILSGRLFEKSLQKGEHLGIYNIQQRLWLLYKENASFSISNNENGGVIVDITLPILYESDGNSNETIDG